MARGAREHTLKARPQYFEDVRLGIKPFEVRKNDRGFERGDVLVLREWYPGAHRYSGRELRRLVTYVLDADDGVDLGLKPGHVVMALGQIPNEAPQEEENDDQSVRCTCQWASEDGVGVGLLYPHVLDTACAVHGAPREFAPGAEYERVYTGLAELAAGGERMRALAAIWYGPEMSPAEPPRWPDVRRDWPVLATELDRLIPPVTPEEADALFAHCEGCTAGIRRSEPFHAWNDGAYTCTSCGGPPGTLFRDGAHVPEGLLVREN